MNGTRWLASPLTGTATVLATLCLLAIPLRKLTSNPPAQPAPINALTTPPSNEIHAVLRLKLLAPAKHAVLTASNGKSLLDTRDLPAGESEYDAMIPLNDGILDLTLRVDTGSATETAVFLTVMPDGDDDQTRYAIGFGQIEQPMHYQWHSN